MLLCQCDACGLRWESNAIVGGPGGSAYVGGNNRIACPRCGASAHTVAAHSAWFSTFEEALQSIQLTKGQAKRIQRKIAEAKDPEQLPVSLEAINAEVGKAVKEALQTAPSREERSHRLTAIAAAVSAFAVLFTAVNNAGENTLVGKAIAAWTQSDDASPTEQHAHPEANDKPFHDPGKHRPKIKG